MSRRFLQYCSLAASSIYGLAGGSPSSGESEEAAEEAKSSGDEWTVRKQSRRSAPQRASQQRLGKLRAAKAAREAQKRRAAEDATRLAVPEGADGAFI